MMRILAVLLSVYIMVLSGIACEDHQHGDIVQAGISTELSADMHNHDGADICNPFFFCHAGHHTFVGEEINTSYSDSGYFEISHALDSAYRFLISIQVWNPPKA